MRTAKRANNGIEFSFGTPQKIISRVVVVELVVLNRIDEAEGQRPLCVLCHLDQTSNRVAPRKKRSVAESLVCVNLRKGVGVDDRGSLADQARRQPLR